MIPVVLVTGGAGFIGSNLVRHLMEFTDWRVVNVDNLSYAGDTESLEPLAGSPWYVFEKADIAHADVVRGLFARHRPQYVMHLAAESHVDRSISGPRPFIETNIVGTFNLLEAARGLWESQSPAEKERFRFLHVSTDEVYGFLGSTGAFTEDSPYKPSSPYSASKASSDHLVRAWNHTFGLPVLVTNCSNNYGPWQFPEKLIPVVITKALKGQPIPIYGKGENVRDWLYVEDHVRALTRVLQSGRAGETYVVGGRAERTNLQLAHSICSILDRIRPRSGGASYTEQITFVTDRPGHDFRYAIEPNKISAELAWKPEESFDSGMEKTVQWYVDNQAWCERLMSRLSGH